MAALCRTFIDTVAETTLEAATSINKLHVGTHVGLASVAADRAGLTVVHNVERSLHRDTHKKDIMVKFSTAVPKLNQALVFQPAQLFLIRTD